MAQGEKKRKISRVMLSNDIFAYLILALPVLLWAFFWLINNVYTFQIAFSDISLKGEVTWKPVGEFFKNFGDFLALAFDKETTLGIGFWNSIKMYVICFVISNPLYLLFSYVIAKKCIASEIWRFAMMLPSMVSAFVMTLMAKMFINGPISQLLGLASPFFNGDYSFTIILIYSIWISFPGMLLIYSNNMRAMDEEILGAAKVDGVNNMWVEFWYIYFPRVWNTFTMYTVTNVGALLLGSGPLVAFYMYSAPAYVYTSGYWFTVQTYNAVNETAVPMLAAGSIMLSVINYLLMRLVKWLMESKGWSED